MWGRRSRRRGSGSEDLWWFCLRHQRVERGPGCPDDVRMGPYSSEQDAAGALARAAERNREFDGSDE